MEELVATVGHEGGYEDVARDRLLKAQWMVTFSVCIWAARIGLRMLLIRKSR